MIEEYGYSLEQDINLLTMGELAEFTVFGKMTGDIFVEVTGIMFGLVSCLGWSSMEKTKPKNLKSVTSGVKTLLIQSFLTNLKVPPNIGKLLNNILLLCCLFFNFT